MPSQLTMILAERRTNFAERARVSDSLFRTMFDIAATGMTVVTTADGNLLDLNSKYCQIIGYTREELLAMRVADYTHPDDRAAEEAQYRKAVDSTAPQFTIEKRLVRKDSKIIWVRINSAFLRDVNGRATRTLSVVEDVTERVGAGVALRDSEHRLRAFLDGIPDRARLKDRQGRYISANLSEAKALGAESVNALIGKTLFDFRPTEIAELVAAEDRHVIESGEMLRVERQSRTRGTWHEIVKAPFRDEAGVAVGLVSIERDITQRVIVEGELRETEHRLLELLDGIPARAWYKDMQGRFIFVNSKEAAAQKRSVESVLGKSVREFMPPSEAEQIMAEDQQVLQLGRTLRIERLSHVTGAWSEIVKAPVRRIDGTVTGIVGILRDISERKQHEAELLAAKSTAEAASLAKGEFLAHMSHEMRTPMNAILGFTELAMLEQPDSGQFDYLEKIGAAAKSLLRVVDDVLEFERIEAGKLELDETTFGLPSVLQNVRDLVERSAQVKGLMLRFHAGEGLPQQLTGDPVRIGQILINLCANAIKFTHSGSVDVFVHVESVAAQSATLHFEVRDTGIGIRPEDQLRLFQAFTQVDNSTTRRYGGTGLGLIICKRLTELMGGKIWMESQQGKGTAVHFTLSCGVTEQPVPGPASRTATLSPDADLLKGVRVLVVDDHPVNRMLISKLLKLAGALPLPAGNGVETLEVLEQYPDVGLVLMDLRMPEMDGYEAARHIRADARWAKLPIIAVTASATTHERARCMAAGMNDVLVKPIQQATFFAALAKWVRQDPVKK